MTFLDRLGPPEFSIVNKRKLNTTPHYVYVAWGSGRSVLYVGQTRNVPGRMAGHRKLAAWWSAARRIDFYRCESRRDALEQEVALIGELKPLWNRTEGNYLMIRRLESVEMFAEVVTEVVA